MTLIFASNNKHKLDELRAFIGQQFEIISLKEAGIDIDIPEPHESLEENASEKSWTVFRLTGQNCFSEDTGLEINALNGEPGVKSARYAGEKRSFTDNINKVLEKMNGEKNRAARFRTVISVILEGKETRFEGICEGRIDVTNHGSKGFGYDPIFIPNGSDKNFAEMTIDEKNQFNHRAKAASKLVAFLQNLNTNHIN